MFDHFLRQYYKSSSFLLDGELPFIMISFLQGEASRTQSTEHTRQWLEGAVILKLRSTIRNIYCHLNQRNVGITDQWLKRSTTKHYRYVLTTYRPHVDHNMPTIYPPNIYHHTNHITDQISTTCQPYIDQISLTLPTIFRPNTDHITDHLPTKYRPFTDQIPTTLPTILPTTLPTTSPTTLPTTYRPHTNHLPTKYRPCYRPHTDHVTDHISTTYRPNTDHISTTCRPHTLQFNPYTIPLVLPGLTEYTFDFNYNTTSLNTWTGDTLTLAGIWQMPRVARPSLTGTGAAEWTAMPPGYFHWWISLLGRKGRCQGVLPRERSFFILGFALNVWTLE